MVLRCTWLTTEVYFPIMFYAQWGSSGGCKHILCPACWTFQLPTWASALSCLRHMSQVGRGSQQHQICCHYKESWLGKLAWKQWDFSGSIWYVESPEFQQSRDFFFLPCFRRVSQWHITGPSMGLEWISFALRGVCSKHLKQQESVP